MAFKVKYPPPTKIKMNKESVEQISYCNFLECDIIYEEENDIGVIHKLRHMLRGREGFDEV